MTIEHVFPQERLEVIGGLEFKVREFYAREFPAVISIASKLDTTAVLEIESLIETESDRLFALLASVTGQPVDVIQRLRGEVLTHLIERIIEENLDFFVRILPATLQRVATKVVGLRQSNS